MYYCNDCKEVSNGEDLKPEEICFEIEFGVENLFQDRHYHTVYHCPHCGSDDVEEAEQCEICGEYFGLEQLDDTSEYRNGNRGLCCEGCILENNMWKD